MLERFFKRFFKQFKYGQKGFTLIELLVVIAILGVLAAVAIPNVSKFVGSGTLAAANTEVATVQTAAIAYASDQAAAGAAPADFVAGPSTVSGGDVLNAYLNKPLTGTYHFDSQGYLVDSTTTTASDPALLVAGDALDPTYPNIAGWNSTTKQFTNTVNPT